MSAHANDTDSSSDSGPDLSDEEFTPNVHDDEARWARMLHVLNQHTVPPTPNLGLFHTPLSSFGKKGGG